MGGEGVGRGRRDESILTHPQTFYKNFLASNGKRILKHRIIMERYLGRKLLPHEIVHHKDKNNQNNDIKNLEIITQSQHIEKHREQLLAARKENR